MRKGQKHAEEWKRKQRERMIGNTYGFQKGKSSVFKGKIRLNMRGKNHPMWKGGYNSENRLFKAKIEYKLWREAIFARDNWICQKCGIRRTELHPHHILNFSVYHELRTSIENGITFCKKCHYDFHTRFGQRKNTKKQLIEFLSTKSS